MWDLGGEVDLCEAGGLWVLVLLWVSAWECVCECECGWFVDGILSLAFAMAGARAMVMVIAMVRRGRKGKRLSREIRHQRGDL